MLVANGHKSKQVLCTECGGHKYCMTFKEEERMQPTRECRAASVLVDD